MYKKRISRATSKRTSNSQPHFSVRCFEIGFDDRVAYIESVCASLIESRFGPGGFCPVIVSLSDRPELEEAVFYDLFDDRMVPCYSLSPQGCVGFQAIEAAYRRAKQMGLWMPGRTRSIPRPLSHQTRDAAPREPLAT